MKKELQRDGLRRMFLASNKDQSLGLPRQWKVIASTIILLFTMGIGQMWGAINNTTVTKAGGSQKYIDVTTTAASDGDEVTIEKQYIAYTINDLISSSIKDVWYTQQSSGSGSSATDAVSITGYRTACNKYISFSSSKTYTFYVTNCVSFSVLYDPRGNNRYCTITATNVDDGEDVLTTTHSGTISSGNKYNVELSGLSASKYYRVVLSETTSNDARHYQIRLGAYVNTTGPFAITYNKNDEGASGTMTDASSPYAKNSTVTVLANSFTAPTGKVFAGWNTKANGTGAPYDAGDTFSATEDVTLYAQWAYPATGTGTITYTLTSNKNEVNAAVTGVNTLSSTSTAFALSTLTCGSGNSKDGYSGKIEGHAADYSASQYVALQFKVADGYTFNPSSVAMTVFANSTSNMKMKVKLTDGTTSVESEELACSNGADSNISFASGAFTNKKFEGDVDMIVYQWGVTGKRTYIKSPVTITGTVAVDVPAATHTLAWDFAGGSTTSTTHTAAGQVAEGATITYPAANTMSKSGFAFTGWSTDVTTMPTSDLTITAQWAQTYAVTYVPNNGVLPAETMTDNNAPYKAGDEVTLLANTFTAPENKEFDAWVVTPTAGGDPITVTAGKFTMPAAAVTVTATWKDACAAAPTVSATTLGTTSYTTQVVNCAGISVLGSAGCTISEYGFVYGTATAPTISDNKKALEGDYTVAGTAFPATTLTGLAMNTKYYVRAYATNSYGTAYGDEVNFTTLESLGNVLVVASSASQTSDAITALRDNGFMVTVSAHDNSRDYTGYDLVVLDESLNGGDAQTAANEESKIKDVNIPILNLKAFFYTKTNRWNWGSPVNGTATNEIANIPTTYKNTQSHPIFAGLTINEGAIDLIDPAVASGKKTLQGVTTNTLVEGKEGYTLATSGTGITFIHELTAAQRGVTDAKYLMIAFANEAKDNLSADGEKLIVNAAKYLVGSTAWVPQYYTVSFDPHGADPIAPLTGNPSITLPTPVNGTGNFLGWFTAATEGTKIGDAGDSYTPTADIELHAQWELISTDARLASITFSSNAGTLSPAFDPEVVNYTYTMPYPTASVPTITGATAVNANAKAPVIDAQAAAWGDVAHIHGVAESDDTKDYYITMKIAPKDGVSIIKVATTGGTNKTVTGLYAGDGDVNLSTGDKARKMDNGKYIGFSLDGTTLQAGDRINVHTSAAANQTGSHIIFYDNMTDKNELYETGEIGGLGDNIFIINAAMVNKATAYVYRENSDAAHQWNGFVDYLEVTRAMNPILTAIQFNSTSVEVTSTTVAATLPNGTNLGTMTVTPTIVWNGVGTSAVTTNEGAWAWGSNTFRVTDKDGDYTDYTITLTEALAPSAAPTITTQPVGDDYYECATIAALEVVATGSGELSYQWYLGDDAIDGATSATYTPTVSAAGTYVYHCVVTNTEAGHPATSLASDNATITITEDPAAIKLINKSTGAINTTNFTTAVAASDDVDGEKGALFNSNRDALTSISALDEMVQYNATTNKTKIQLSMYNTSSAEKTIYLFKLEEGEETAEKIEITIDGSSRKTTDFYAFDSEKNRSFYVTVSDKKVQILQVKVIDNGATAMKQFGQAGYSLNFNKGRMFAKNDGSAYAFEGALITVSSDYKILNNSSLATKSNIQFNNATANAIMKVTRASGNYYVSQDPSDKGTIYNKNQEIVLDDTTNPWYIGSETSSSAASFTKIEFVAPKCAEPAFNALANSELCEGDAFVALDGTATVADAGVPTYQWYNATNDEAIDGETNATYTPTAEGSYYVIATNHLANYSDNEKKSATVTVTRFASAVITTAPVNIRKDVGYNGTLTVEAAGKAPLNYTWYTCNEDGTGAVAIPGESGPAKTSLAVTVAAGVQYYKVVVESTCGNAEAVAKVEEWVELSQVDVTTSTVWDWDNAVLTSEQSSVPSAGAIITGETGTYVVLANVDHIYYGEEFNSRALVGLVGQNAWRSSSYKAFQGAGAGMLKFHPTVAGVVRVLVSSSNGNTDTEITIGNSYSKVFQTANAGRGKAIYTDWVEVPADADVVIGTGTAQSMRIYRIEFYALDQTRDDAWIAPGELGTICYPNGHVVVGAEMYQMKGTDENGKFVFDEVTVTEPGVPYLFRATSSDPIKFYKTLADAAVEAGTSHGMVGTFVEIIIPQASPNKYYFSGTKFYAVTARTTDLTVPANRAYVDLTTPHPAAAPKQGVRRIVFDVQGGNSATGIDELNASEKPVKIMIDGTMYILRGEKMYDATGRLVK